MRAADISTRGTTSEGARNATARSQQVKASRKFRGIRIVGSLTIIPKNPCVCGKFPSGLIRKTVRVTGLVFSV